MAALDCPGPNHYASGHRMTPPPLSQWIGKTESATDLATAAPYAALSAALDWPAQRPIDGTPLPALWHWLYFLPLHRQSEIGADGPGRRGAFMPPVALPRRMWAGSQLQFHRPLRIGDALMRRSFIESIQEKSGRSGALVFVRVRHELHRQGEAEVALTEWHDFVYREAAKPGDAAPAPRPAPTACQWSRRLTPDEVLLFRCSALTFHGHRIHYDRSYATQTGPDSARPADRHAANGLAAPPSSRCRCGELRVQGPAPSVRRAALDGCGAGHWRRQDMATLGRRS